MLLEVIMLAIRTIGGIIGGSCFDTISVMVRMNEWMDGCIYEQIRELFMII